MRTARALTLPMVLGVAAALLAGCSDTAGPTQTDQAQLGPSFSQPTYRARDDRNNTCPDGFNLQGYTSGYGWEKYDHNDNGFICYKPRV